MGPTYPATDATRRSLSITRAVAGNVWPARIRASRARSIPADAATAVRVPGVEFREAMKAGWSARRAAGRRPRRSLCEDDERARTKATPKTTN